MDVRFQVLGPETRVPGVEERGPSRRRQRRQQTRFTDSAVGEGEVVRRGSVLSPWCASGQDCRRPDEIGGGCESWLADGELRSGLVGCGGGSELDREGAGGQGFDVRPRVGEFAGAVGGGGGDEVEGCEEGD